MVGLSNEKLSCMVQNRAHILKLLPYSRNSSEWYIDEKLIYYKAESRLWDKGGGEAVIQTLR